jgi:hypothetical protein
MAAPFWEPETREAKVVPGKKFFESDTKRD